MSTNQNTHDDPKNVEIINETVKQISINSKSNSTLINEQGMCEVCGLRKAEVNLDLEFGSHRECRICWND